jgi:hypothetical protein
MSVNNLKKDNIELEENTIEISAIPILISNFRHNSESIISVNEAADMGLESDVYYLVDRNTLSIIIGEEIPEVEPSFKALFFPLE